MENRGQIFAFDADRNRLAPIYERLKRAGARNVQVRPPAAGALDDLAGRMSRVLVDAPCSGTGIWRRRPDAKWRITPDAIEKRTAEQDQVLSAAARYVKPGGVLAYATCSLLASENSERIAAFLAAHEAFEPVGMREAWRRSLPGVNVPAAALEETSLLLTPRRTGTDGFFLALLRRRGPEPMRAVRQVPPLQSAAEATGSEELV
jgi:16S rRNA (cytosine967-C5)-methyltransferase